MFRKLFSSLSFLLIVAFLFTACEKKADPSEENDDNDSTTNIRTVLAPGNGWKSLASIHALNTSATGLQYYDLTQSMLSIDMSDVVHFILCDAKKSQQDWFYEYYEGTVNLSNGDKYLSKMNEYLKDRYYYYKPNTSELYSSWTNNLQGPFNVYSNSHPAAISGYQGIPLIDESGNVMTARTLSGVGTENFIFLRRAGSSEDSLFTDGSQAIILSGFYPALMSNGNIYCIVKQGKTVSVQRANHTNYSHNQRGFLETIASIECPTFLDDISTSFVAKMSNDKRYIYYWIAENYSYPSKGWFFKFDAVTENFTRIYDAIDLVNGIAVEGSNTSKIAAIGDDGSLYIAFFVDPNVSKPVSKIYKINGDGTATGAILYKSANLLLADSYGNNYRINTLQYLNGKVYFTVQSGLLAGENPQLDIIAEE